MSAEDDDAHLVALIDGELGDAARRAIEARLVGDAALREGLARLRDGGRPFAAVFRPLLDEAPVERLKASLAALESGRPDATPPRWWTLRRGGLAAAAAIVLFCSGIGVGRYALGPSEDDDWRQAVIDYVKFYTPETFAPFPAPPESELAALGAKIGVNLTRENTNLANLQLKGGVIFAYEGAPLAQLSYVGPASGPVLFCIIHNAEPDAAPETVKRDGFAVASWAHGGRGFVLVGHLPVVEIAGLADTLRRRF